MKKFKGFQQGKLRLIPIPEPFFRELLPLIDDLGELQVTLYAFWRLDRKEGALRYLMRADFSADPVLMHALAGSGEGPEEVLDQALRRAVARGTLLEAPLSLGDELKSLYFMNTPRGRAAIQALQRGEWRPSEGIDQPVEILETPPNIYRLYEEHIGPLSPMIADALRDAEAEFPSAWIEDALRIAVENNARNWRYIRAILDRWQEKGRDEQEDRRDTEKARRKYSEWENLGSG